MKAFIYILYSEKLDRYYIGSTELAPQKRLELHLSKNYGFSKYTAKADDWIIYDSRECVDVTKARKVERYLKRMRNRSFIESGLSLLFYSSHIRSHICLMIGGLLSKKEVSFLGQQSLKKKPLVIDIENIVVCLQLVI